MRRQSSGWICLLAVLATVGCNSLPKPTTTWRGEEDGRVKVTVTISSPALPEKAWLVASEPDSATGLVIYTKWGEGAYRYHQRSYFILEETWRSGVDHIGIIENGEFCTVNPEHGGFSDGNSFTTTYAYDYCAALARR